MFGLICLAVIAAACVLSLPWSLQRYDAQTLEAGATYQAPSWREPMGTDLLGRSLAWRCLLGGAISLGVGAAAASLALVIGVTWGALAGFLGGRWDALMMRCVDVLYGLPYILLVVLIDLALQPAVAAGLEGLFPDAPAASLANVLTLLVAIGGVSWLTMARVIRGQVLSLREQPFIEAARACGLGPFTILRRHLLPNLWGPMIVYATLAVPQAILQESLLSFLGIGVQAPLPSWGNLAAEALPVLSSFAMLGDPSVEVRWWLLFWPCLLLGLTLLSLNLIGDALRDRLDPRTRDRTTPRPVA